MQNIELREETPLTPLEHERIKRKPQDLVARKIMRALEDVPKELRKKEAAEPLYLIRYE